MDIKNYLRILILFATPIVSNAQNTSSEIELVRHNYIQFSKYSEDRNDWDSAAHYETLFKNSLMLALQRDFSTNYGLLKTVLIDGNHINFLSSTDKKLHFICWDDQSGGTMRNASCLVAVDSNGKMIVSDYYYTNDEGDFNPFVRELHQVQSTSGAVYVVLKLFIGSSALYYPSFETMTINIGKLNEDAKYIKTANGMTNLVSYEVDFTSSYYRKLNKSRDDIDFLIHYLPASQTIYFPVVLENGEVTNRKIQYKFNGMYFVKVKR